MKKILSILFIIFSVSSFAQVSISNTSQVTIGEIRKLGFPVATLQQQITNSDTSFTLRYRDMQEWDADKYYSIQFKASPLELQQLYQAFASVHDEKNLKNKDYALQITLGNTPITIKNYKYSGVTMCEVRTPNGYFQLTKGQVPKLFGKD
jgi:hypothetical protein